MKESNYSSMATAAVGTVQPGVSYTPATSTRPGFDPRIVATVTDDVDMYSVTLGYRPPGGAGPTPPCRW